MKYIDVMKYCLALQGVSRKALSTRGDAFGFCVDGKIFAYLETGAPIQWRFTVAVTPENLERLQLPPQVLQARDKPGGAWLTIMRVENFDGDLLRELIDWSYGNAPGGIASTG